MQVIDVAKQVKTGQPEVLTSPLFAEQTSNENDKQHALSQLKNQQQVTRLLLEANSDCV